MGLLDYTYRLKALDGDTTPHDELGVSGDLSGGTITLVDDGSGGKTWRFSGAATVSAPSRAVDSGVTGSGATIAFRMRINTEGTGTSSSTSRFVGYKTADTNDYGLYVYRNGSATTSYVYKSASGLKGMLTSYSAGTGWRTFVLKLNMVTGTANDSSAAWYDGGASHPTADGTNGPSSGFGNITMARVEIGNGNSAVIDISDFVIWAEELSDADCATLVDDGIRATLDATGTDYNVTIDQGLVTFAGQDVTFTHSPAGTYSLSIDPGVITFSGQSSSSGFATNVNHGILTFSAKNVTLRWSGDPAVDSGKIRTGVGIGTGIAF